MYRSTAGSLGVAASHVLIQVENLREGTPETALSEGATALRHRFKAVQFVITKIADGVSNMVA
jgi:hypothetical protein